MPIWARTTIRPTGRRADVVPENTDPTVERLTSASNAVSQPAASTRVGDQKKASGAGGEPVPQPPDRQTPAAMSSRRNE